jgi:hypothetical protein
MDFNVAGQSNKAAMAKQRLEAQFANGRDKRDQIVDLVSRMVITDALVLPSRMVFSLKGRDVQVSLDGKATLGVHAHALAQIGGVFEYPLIYLKRLSTGLAGIPVSVCRDKLTTDLNWHASRAVLKDRKGNPAKYLCRYVDNELRGFLSRSFKRHLASKPLLRAFIAACDQVGLVPIDAHASPVRVNLQCVLPHVFEPFEGEFLVAGVAWSNSDFGGGRMKVSMFARRVNGVASLVLDDAISEVHIGPVIEESDIEMSTETVQAELEAQRRAIKDAVVGQVTPDNVNKLCEVVRLAQEESIPWHRLRAELGSLLQKNELEALRGALLDSSQQGFEALPPVEFDDADDPKATRWWAAAALGQLAEREPDAERKKAIQELAGKTVGKTKK